MTTNDWVGDDATTARVSDDAMVALRFEVLRKHGKIYGALREELDAAIWAHVKALQDESLEG